MEACRILLMLIPGLLIMSFIGTFLIRRIALKYNVMDIPNKRSSHNIPTPRGGGIAIVSSFYFGITILYLIGAMELTLFLALLAGIFLSIIGLFDDLLTIKPSIRLAFQMISAFLALLILSWEDPTLFSGMGSVMRVILYSIAFFGILWFINLYNFLDGIDAYASLETIYIAAGMYLLYPDPLFLCLIAIVCGFLYWNWPKARIFMGDTGSTQLGYVLIVVGLYHHNSGHFNILHWIMLSSVFWFDASLTLFRRLWNGERITQPHKKHAYQRVVQAGFSHLQTDVYALLLNIFILAIVILSNHYQILVFPGLGIIVLVLYLVTRVVDGRIPFTNNPI